MNDLENLILLDYREPFICPYHNCITENGWCWECAEETYGYEEAKRVHGNTNLAKTEGK